MILITFVLLFLQETCSAAKFDALFEMQMREAQAAYLQRKQNQGLIAQGTTWEEIQSLSFKGVEISSYVPLAHFFLNLFGDSFDYYLALQSCQGDQ